jgi:hypothetical protein
MDYHREDQTQRVHDYVALATLDLPARVVTARPPTCLIRSGTRGLQP